ncbi:MAG: uracil-DNA glycosylase [Bdellovibrionales bacterium]
MPNALKSALEFYVDIGVDECLQDEPANRISESQNPRIPEKAEANPVRSEIPRFGDSQILGKTQAQSQSVQLAQSAQTLEELRTAITDFDGISLKKTATNLVFSDGNPQAHVMIIGEAPGADEDRQGKPFVGVSGQLLDKILRCIDLSRTAGEPEKSVYLTNILNWRPPGNRTPSPAEIAVSLPFIERHIQLIKPKVIILCGGVSAKTMLGSGDSFSKLRKKFHDYTPQTPELQENAAPIPAIATFHPIYLLSTPVQKRAVWQDMLMLQDKLKSVGS